MTDYTATVYGIGDSRKYTDKTTTNTDLSPILRAADPNKGQISKRFIIAAGSEIMGGEIWVNGDTTLAAADTLTFTVTDDG